MHTFCVAALTKIRPIRTFVTGLSYSMIVDAASNCCR